MKKNGKKSVIQTPIDKAVKAVLAGRLSAYAAAKKYGVVQSTISRRLRKIEMGSGATVETPRPVCPHCGQTIARAPSNRRRCK